jgi:hypothetical protein
MADLQITCINKVNRDSSHEGITHLGANNLRWTRSEVIAFIEKGTHTFYTMVNNKRANVRVVDGSYGKYLRTYADDDYNDNLLALPECSR